MCWIIFHLFSRTHNFWTKFGILIMVYPYSSSLLSYASMAEIDDVVSKWKLAYFFPKVHFIFIHHNFDRTLDSFGGPLFQSFPSPKYVSAGSTYKLVLLSCLTVCTLISLINVEGGILWKKLMHNSNKWGVEGEKKSKESINVEGGFFFVEGGIFQN